jgi:hypothetical protein
MSGRRTTNAALARASIARLRSTIPRVRLIGRDQGPPPAVDISADRFQPPPPSPGEAPVMARTSQLIISTNGTSSWLVRMTPTQSLSG